MDTLLEMKSYAEEKLYKAYKRAFPRSNPELLRSYKRELWTALQDILTRPEVPEIDQEVEVWRHLWLSVILWRRGLTNLAYIHWSQAVHKATQIGWYEVALWASSLLEIYVRDFHKTADAKEVSSWAQTLLGLVRQRYEGLLKN
ncbi:MAG: hypothetical protein N2170_00830 [Bacteroidia bacterium]|nr:hypothetical protein [Bacteroidia bacterium]